MYIKFPKVYKFSKMKSNCHQGFVSSRGLILNFLSHLAAPASSFRLFSTHWQKWHHRSEQYDLWVFTLVPVFDENMLINGACALRGTSPSHHQTFGYRYLNLSMLLNKHGYRRRAQPPRNSKIFQICRYFYFII